MSINYDDLEDLTLTMEDEDGNTTECELQFVFEYEGQDYGAFCEPDDDSGAFYFFTLDGDTNWKGEIELEVEPVEDDALLEQLVEALQEIVDDDNNDSDPFGFDEEEEDDDEDDGMWDEFINKKLEE